MDFHYSDKEYIEMIRVNRQEEQSAGIYSTSSSLLPCEGFAIDVDIITVLFPVRYTSLW